MRYLRFTPDAPAGGAAAPTAEEKAAAAKKVDAAAAEAGLPLTKTEREQLIARVAALEQRPAMTAADVQALIDKAIAGLKPTTPADPKKETEKIERTGFGGREIVKRKEDKR